MQTLDIISVNLWQILISLVNLLLIFLILKHVLYKPVNKILAERRAALDGQYAAAAEAERQAQANRQAWEEKIGTAEAEADAILQTATENASRRGDKMIAEARERADGIVRQAQSEAELERKKAEDGIRHEIVEVSAALTEKMLGREINQEDHRSMIDSFIEEMGENDDGNK